MGRGIFRKRASADEALDYERAHQLICAARLTGAMAGACPACGYPDVVLVERDRYSRGLATLTAHLAGALRHPSTARGYVVACASCEAGFAVVTMGRATP